MAKPRLTQPTLFSMEMPEPSMTAIKLDPAMCPHLIHLQSVTIWPGEDFERLTMTCQSCGRVRGRYPKE